MAIEVLERIRLPYMIVGSAASSIYGKPRMTQDIDVVIDPTLAQIQQLCREFPSDDFYVSEEAAIGEFLARAQFKVIHPESGNQIDFMNCGLDAWGQSQLARRRRMTVLPGVEAVAASPEDVILAKMLYYKEGGSEKHLRDIAGMLKVGGDSIDRTYVAVWARTLAVSEVWEAVVARLSS